MIKFEYFTVQNPDGGYYVVTRTPGSSEGHVVATAWHRAFADAARMGIDAKQVDLISAIETG